MHGNKVNMLGVYGKWMHGLLWPFGLQFKYHLKCLI